MKNNPLVTIITSTFNAANDLENSIKSVIAQSYSNIEYIIIDGGSTDGTLEIIKKHEKNISIIVSEKDNGIYDAWNKGLSLATGDWIAFLGADDEYLPDAVLNYVNHIEKYNNMDDLDYVSSKVELIDTNYKTIRVIGRPWNWQKFKRYMCTAHVGSFHSKSYFDKYGKFDTSYKITGDYELLLRANDSLKTVFLDNVTVKMKMGGTSNVGFKVFKEAFNAKIKTGARSFFMATLDTMHAKTIFLINKILFKL